MPGPGIQTSPYDLNLRGFLKDYGIHPSASSPVNLKNAAAFGHFQRTQELHPAASFLLSSSPYNYPSVPVFMVLVFVGHPVNGIICDVAFGAFVGSVANLCCCILMELYAVWPSVCGFLHLACAVKGRPC